MKVSHLLVLAGLLLASGFVALGLWQWQRGAAKAELLQAWDAARTAPPLPAAVALGSDSALPQRIEAQGRFMGPLLLLDNQQREGRVGLRHYRAFEPCCDLPLLLVELGWRPWGEGRTLPPATALPESMTLSGTLVPWPGQGLRLGEEAWRPDGLNRILLMRLDQDFITQGLDRALHPRVLRLDPGPLPEFVRDPVLLPNTLPPERHRGYAVQWFALAAAVLAVILILQFRSRPA